MSTGSRPLAHSTRAPIARATITAIGGVAAPSQRGGFSRRSKWISGRHCTGILQRAAHHQDSDLLGVGAVGLENALDPPP